MSQNPIVQRIAAAGQGASVGRSASRQTQSADLAHAEAAYLAAQSIIRGAIGELIGSLQVQKQNLLDEYSEQTLREQRGGFEGFADVFLAMATDTTDNCYAFISRTRDRQRCALEVSKAARSVAQHFESTWRGAKVYSMTLTAEKIQKLIIALRNLDAQSV